MPRRTASASPRSLNPSGAIRGGIGGKGKRRKSLGRRKSGAGEAMSIEVAAGPTGKVRKGSSVSPMKISRQEKRSKKAKKHGDTVNTKNNQAIATTKKKKRATTKLGVDDINVPERKTQRTGSASKKYTRKNGKEGGDMAAAAARLERAERLMDAVATVVQELTSSGVGESSDSKSAVSVEKDELIQKFRQMLASDTSNEVASVTVRDAEAGVVPKNVPYVRAAYSSLIFNAAQRIIREEADEAEKRKRVANTPTKEEFRDAYRAQFTDAFADELEGVRKAVRGGFGEREMELLVEIIEDGMHIFDEEEKQIFVHAANGRYDEFFDDK
mmetsp:Transcript_30642/g.74658  ORF Transcript_30642/g.74658 Transcript_30642/m.74658 type:complete len:328 (-) Transcript_30642:119-1102(-)